MKWIFGLVLPVLICLYSCGSSPNGPVSVAASGSRIPNQGVRDVVKAVRSGKPAKMTLTFYLSDLSENSWADDEGHLTITSPKEIAQVLTGFEQSDRQSSGMDPTEYESQESYVDATFIDAKGEEIGRLAFQTRSLDRDAGLSVRKFVERYLPSNLELDKDDALVPKNRKTK